MYTQKQLNQVRVYEQSIRDAMPKTLCNARAVTEMRYIIRNLLDHIEAAPLTSRSSRAANACPYCNFITTDEMGHCEACGKLTGPPPA